MKLKFKKEKEISMKSLRMFLLSITTLILCTSQVFAEAIPELSVSDYTLISKNRVGRTLFEYTFSVTASNSSTDNIENITASVSSTSSSITVISPNNISFNNVSGSNSTQATTNLVVRIDRRASFDESNLVWDFDGERKQSSNTIAGADLDNNGIWDYIDEFINNDYPSSSLKRSALQQTAIAFQQFLLDANDPVKSLDNSEALGMGIDCLWEVMDENEVLSIPIEAQIINTLERHHAYMKATDHLSGQIMRESPSPCQDLP